MYLRFFIVSPLKFWGKHFSRTSMRETSAKTVTRVRYFSRYPENTVGFDYQVADTTQLLRAWAGGDTAALGALAPRVYQELHRLAVDFMRREREEPILQATALVHEVYLKLIDVQNVTLEGKAHFFAICAQMMRRILVDAARKRAASRHGGGQGRIHLEDVAHLDLSQPNDKQLIALNDALDELAQGDPRKARVVELRYFGGLNVEDTAAVLKVSVETVTRDWRLARGWLLLQIKGANGSRVSGLRRGS
jgi:RNA polymerase sigma factor (TIGR02999 family)